jgi:hypothetical protein
MLNKLTQDFDDKSFRILNITEFGKTIRNYTKAWMWMRTNFIPILYFKNWAHIQPEIGVLLHTSNVFLHYPIL